MGGASLPAVTVIVPVYNDRARLALCLSALAAQDYPAERVEVIVVDNGSDPGERPEGIAQAGPPAVRLLDEPRPGSYAARNRGLSAARGEVIAFTDADCIPDPRWLSEGVAALSADPAAAVAVGGIAMFRVAPERPPTAVELYEQALAFDPAGLLRRENYGVTANLFVRRATLDTVGPFDESLKAGGDRDWGRRVHAAGLKQVLVEAACVRHPALGTRAALRRKVIRLAGGRYDLAIGGVRGPTRHFRALAMLLGDLGALPVATAYHLLLDGRVRGLRDRLRYTGTCAWVRWVAFVETLRRHSGKPSSRA